MYFGCILMKAGSWKQAGGQRHGTARFSLGRVSRISSLKYPVVLHDFFPPLPRTELSMSGSWLLWRLEGGGETSSEKLLHLNHSATDTRATRLRTAFYSSVCPRTSGKAVRDERLPRGAL